jgi:hypothetical protein
VSGLYNINVPQGATRLDLSVTVDPGRESVAIYILYGSTISSDSSGGPIGANYLGYANSSQPYQGSILANAPAGSLSLTPGTWTVGLYMEFQIFSTLTTSGTILATISSASGPTIFSLSPTSVTAGVAPFSLTVNGAGYVPGSAVQWNGTSLSTTYVSATQLTAQIPASLIGAQASCTITVVNPGGAVSNVMTFTILPGIAGAMAQVAFGGGWQTTFTLVNMGSASADARLSFFDNDGNAMFVPLALVQSGATMGTQTLDQTIAADASLLVLIQDTGATRVGSAQLIFGNGVNGFAIFRYSPTGQEAVVPLETRNASEYMLAFDNTNGVSTGVALANVANQAANVPVVIYDDSGTQIATNTISLAAQGHTSFMLTSNYGVTAGKRGTIEFDTPPLGQITVLGLRANGSALTTLPALAGATAGGGSSAHLVQRVAK